MKFYTNSEIETKKFAKEITNILPIGSVIALYGDLGAGKTTFVRGVAEALNIKEVVQSPTFNIMKIYLKGDKPLIHIDAYRLADINNDIGLDEYIGYETGFTLIEWPMYIANLLPEDVINIEIKNLSDDKREFNIDSKHAKFMEELNNVHDLFR